MNIPKSLATATANGVICIALLFPVVSLSAAAPAPGTALSGEGSAILMGVAAAAAASTQTAERQNGDRAALRQRLGYLIGQRMTLGMGPNGIDDVSRIVRVVFDVGPDGRAVNVRVGKRSGDGFTDSRARHMIARFDGLPGGERYRVCAVLQYGHRGQDPNEAAFIKALNDARDDAITDMRAGRDGPASGRHGYGVIS